MTGSGPYMAKKECKSHNVPICEKNGILWMLQMYSAKAKSLKNHAL